MKPQSSSFLKTCMKSIIGQNYLNYEILICYDDNNSINDLNKYTSHPKISTFKLNKIDKNDNFVNNLYINELFIKIKDGWLLFIDDDDEFAHDMALDRIRHRIQKEDDVIFWKVKNDNQLIYPKNINKIEKNDIIIQCACFHSKYITTTNCTSTLCIDDYFITKILPSAILNRKVIDSVLVDKQQIIINIINDKDIRTKNIVFNGNINHSGYSLAIVNKNFLNSLKPYVNDTIIFDNIIENKMVNTEDNILMFMGWPPNYSENYKICVNYGWEESFFPEEYLTRFQKLDYITVVSEYVKYTLINNGLKIPIFVTNNGYDRQENDSEIVTNNNTYVIDTKKKFKLLHISSCFVRKGIDELLYSYFKGFNGNDNICLYIKTFKNIHNENLNSTIETFKNNHPNPPEIIVNFEMIKSKDIESLIHASTCIINTSNSEGFGLPALEAMAKKKPVIVTNYSGFKDFCNDKNAFLVDFDYINSNSHFSSENNTSYYAKPKTDSIIYNIKKVMSLSQDKLLQHVEYSYKSIKNLTWNNNVRKNINAYYLNKNIIKKKPKIGVISTLSDYCGIGIHTQKLFKLDKNITFLIPTNEQCYYNNDNIIKCWNNPFSDVKNIDMILKNITNLDVIMIQYHPGFYSWELLLKLCMRIKNLNKLVLVEMHCLENSQLGDLEFKYIDRILVHTIYDLNIMKIKNNRDNLLLLELPFKKTDKNINLNNHIRTISTFGFCFEDKGLIELVVAFKALKRRDLTLNLYCCTFHKSVKSAYVEKLKSLILSTNNINFISDYQEESVIRNFLDKSDLIVFPALDSSESASASSRIGIESLKPVLISNSSKHNDIINHNFVFKFDIKTNPVKSLVYELKKILLLGKQSLLNKCIAQKEFIQENTFDKINKKLLDIVHSLYINSF